MEKTPKEYAQELVSEFSLVGLQQRNEGIACAKIAVDKEIDSLMWLNLLCNFNNPMKHTIEQKITELKQVKTEIENL